MEFPATLPSLDRRNDTSFQVNDNVQTWTNARGIDAERPRSSATEIAWTLGHGAYTEAQLRELIEFHRAARGQWFSMASPASGVVRSFKFVSPPSGKSAGGGKFSVSIAVKELVV